MPSRRFSSPPLLGHNDAMPILLLLTLLLVTPQAVIASDAQAILQAAEDLGRKLAAGQPGEVRVVAGPIDSSQLAACSALETSPPANPRNLGRIHVGVRCLAPVEWNILVPVQISVIADYVVTRKALLAGRNIQSDDLASNRGDLAALPPGTLLKPEQAIGKTLRNSIAAGHPLRANQLRSPLVIRQGQAVRVIARGNGFEAKAEGKALNNATAGEVARVRMSSGKTLGGVAQEDGSILLAN